MILDETSSVAELRSELDRRRKRALDLQMDTTDPEEWKNLNIVRWELEDLDRDLYLSRFINNNDTLEKLIGRIEQAGGEAEKITETLKGIRKAVQGARKALKKASALFPDLDAYYKEIETMLETLRA